MFLIFLIYVKLTFFFFLYFIFKMIWMTNLHRQCVDAALLYKGTIKLTRVFQYNCNLQHNRIYYWHLALIGSSISSCNGTGPQSVDVFDMPEKGFQE